MTSRMIFHYTSVKDQQFPCRKDLDFGARFYLCYVNHKNKALLYIIRIILFKKLYFITKTVNVQAVTTLVKYITKWKILLDARKTETILYSDFTVHLLLIINMSPTKCIYNCNIDFIYFNI